MVENQRPQNALSGLQNNRMLNANDAAERRQALGGKHAIGNCRRSLLATLLAFTALAILKLLQKAGMRGTESPYA